MELRRFMKLMNCLMSFIDKMYENINNNRLKTSYEVWLNPEENLSASFFKKHSEHVEKSLLKNEKYLENEDEIYRQCRYILYCLKFRKTAILIKHCGFKMENLITCLPSNSFKQVGVFL